MFLGLIPRGILETRFLGPGIHPEEDPTDPNQRYDHQSQLRSYIDMHHSGSLPQPTTHMPTRASGKPAQSFPRGDPGSKGQLSFPVICPKKGWVTFSEPGGYVGSFAVKVIPRASRRALKRVEGLLKRVEGLLKPERTVYKY